ncbi:GNAT family N-acetyltransferase [Candidatus Pacebacteria bacterium]|nr:GNAT family N-acetyltransferase [Candidatus Paceibacterota bacterium]
MEYTYKTLDQIPHISDDFAERYNTLISQLTSRPSDVAVSDLDEVKERVASELLLCVFTPEDVLVGLAQGTYLCTPPNYILYINTVVVDTSQRGSGLGTHLMEKIEDLAKERWPQIRKITFTSGPDRNTRGFYERLGYIARVPENNNETIMYVKDMKGHIP